MKGRPQTESQPQTAYLGLGANLGDRIGALRGAVAALDRHDAVRVDFETGVASLYETSPVGGPANQPPYLNSVAGIDTTLTPRELLALALDIESQLGRSRERRREARVIDIDLLLHGDAVIEEQGLIVPHPRLHERRFVLEALSELAGSQVHPVLGVSINELARRARRESPDQSVVRIAPSGWLENAAKQRTAGKSGKINALDSQPAPG